MRTLVLLRGTPGCGKSTWVENMGLEGYMVSADTIRLMIQSPVTQADGTHRGVLGEDGFVWDILFQLLEKRMNTGEFTVVDATHSKISAIHKYRELANKYRYRVVCVDFSEVSLEVAMRQNAGRVDYKRVPQRAIETIYNRIQESKVPSYIETIYPDEFVDRVEWKPVDLGHYARVHHIGDVHGCMTVLNEYLSGGLNSSDYYIFTGDYIDRGVENGEIMKFLLSIYNLPNVCLLEGNHEKHLWNWAYGVEMSDDLEFIRNTESQLTEIGIGKKDARMLCRKFRQMVWYTWRGQEVFCCHGGISTWDRNPLYVPSKLLISGTGEYVECEMSDTTFSKRHPDVVQVHGHRNLTGMSVKSSDNCFNLEGAVEHGGNLRTVTLGSDGWIEAEVRNTVYKISEFEKNVAIQDTKHLIELLKASPFVTECQMGKISSFAFKQSAFFDGIWNNVSTRARGLFINLETEKIVARSYDKFFNLGEREETKRETLRDTLVFPADVFEKENGFLGIMGYNEDTDSLLFCSKSRLGGPYPRMFKDIFDNLHGPVKGMLHEYLREQNCSAVFEVIDPVGDPHIIEYDEKKVVLLDIVKNDMEFEAIPYVELVRLATEWGIPVKNKICTLGSMEDFDRLLDRAELI